MTQPPEGVLDPKNPWYTAKVGERTWKLLKARLTGKKMDDGTHYSSFVNLSDAEADTLISNMKKDSRGYPQFNNTGGAKEYENLEKYQQWLVEEYLTKPQANKVEELKNQAQKDKESVPLDRPQTVAKVTTKKEESLKKIGSTMKGGIKSFSVQPKKESSEDVQPVLKAVEPIISKKVEDNTEKQVQTVIDSVKPESKPEEKKETFDTQKALGAGLSSVSESLKVTNDRLDAIVNINEKNYKATQTILKGLNEIKGILLGQTQLQQESIQQDKQATAEAGLEGTKDSSGTAAYQKTYDDTPGNDQQQQDQGGGFNPFQVIDAMDDAYDLVRLFRGGKGRMAGLRGRRKGLGNQNRAFRKFRKTRAGGFLGRNLNLPRGIRSLGRRKLSGGGFLNTPYPAMSKGGIPLGAQPVMLGEAGPEIVTPPKLAGGGLRPGLYDNPTRGNLLPGQAVIPLNRNSGKEMTGSVGGITKGEGLGLAQPLATAMTLPFKAVGAGIFGLAASFLPVLGPLAGLVKPLLRFIVRPLGKILGIPTKLLDAALGKDTDMNSGIGGILSSMAKDLGLLDDKEDGKKDENKKGDGSAAPSETDPTGEVQPEDYPKSLDAAFKKVYDIAVKVSDPVPELTAAQAMFEGDWLRSPRVRLDNNPFGQTGSGTAGKVYANGRWWARYKTLEDAIKSHIDRWATTTPLGGSGYGSKGGAPIPGLLNILQKYAPSSENNHSTYIGSIKRMLVSYGFNPYKKNDRKQLSAESGTSTGETKDTTSYMMKGPNSGYPVKITTNDGQTTSLTAHGKESVHIGKSGFTVLPHENNKWSVSKNPFDTFQQWNKVLSDPAKEKGSVSKPMKMESGGVHRNGRPQMNDWRAADAARQTRRNKTNRTAQRERLGVFRGSDGRWVAHGVSDKAVGSNPWWQVWNKKGATAERRKKQEKLAKDLAARLNKEEDNIRRLHPAASQEIQRASNTGSASVNVPTRKPKPPEPKEPALDPKLTPMQNWAKLFPKLAEKVKPGQSGYSEIQEYFLQQKLKSATEKGFEAAAKGMNLAPGAKVPPATKENLQAITAATASTILTTAFSTPQIVPIPSSPAPPPSHVIKQETIQSTRQKELLCRL